MKPAELRGLEAEELDPLATSSQNADSSLARLCSNNPKL
jgi:hypothetical protein